ncbi:hypothetical protein QOT17_003154 [Balamuthia mandrillaris]
MAEEPKELPKNDRTADLSTVWKEVNEWANTNQNSLSLADRNSVSQCRVSTLQGTVVGGVIGSGLGYMLTRTFEKPNTADVAPGATKRPLATALNMFITLAVFGYSGMSLGSDIAKRSCILKFAALPTPLGQRTRQICMDHRLPLPIMPKPQSPVGTEGRGSFELSAEEPPTYDEPTYTHDEPTPVPRAASSPGYTPRQEEEEMRTPSSDTYDYSGKEGDDWFQRRGTEKEIATARGDEEPYEAEAAAPPLATRAQRHRRMERHPPRERAAARRHDDHQYEYDIEEEEEFREGEDELEARERRRRLRRRRRERGHRRRAKPGEVEDIESYPGPEAEFYYGDQPSLKESTAPPKRRVRTNEYGDVLEVGTRP